ncbi:response regulator [Thalassobium sp. R2A62]|uniref:response regulator n=1 Tax=Thalassobium sp. R2A62 TaxID=633131 RepID=UPI00350E58AF
MEAQTGQEALALAIQERPDLILSDWVMPEISGPELCKQIRQELSGQYVYFIFLTSKSEKTEVAEGLVFGADDFLTKPVNTQELRARISAGERILQMERALIEKTQELGSALAEIQKLYNDLIEAKGLQQSLLPETQKDFGAAKVSIVLQSSGHLGGDLVSYFPVNDRRIGFFGLDVSGHGISSAMMTARLAGLLSRAAPDQNMAII